MTEETEKKKEHYTYREMRFLPRQMIWVAENIFILRDGNWPIEPPNHAEEWTSGASPDKKYKRNRFGKPAHFEKPDQIASEFDWRLSQCWDKQGSYGEWFIDIYGRKLTYEMTAIKHHVTVDIVDSKVSQILRYISGWKRKTTTFEEYNQQRRK